MRKIYGRKLKVFSVKYGYCFNSIYLLLSFYLELKNEKKNNYFNSYFYGCFFFLVLFVIKCLNFNKV